MGFTLPSEIPFFSKFTSTQKVALLSFMALLFSVPSAFYLSQKNTDIRSQATVNTILGTTTGNKITWKTTNVSLEADSFVLNINGKQYYGIPDLGSSAIQVQTNEANSQYNTFIARWKEKGDYLNFGIYFKINSGNWYIDSIHAYYSNQSIPDWLYFYEKAIPPTSIGYPYSKLQIDIPSTQAGAKFPGSLHFENLKLQPFLSTIFSSCSDSDGGENYYVKGKTNGIAEYNNQPINGEDFCWPKDQYPDGEYIAEWFCKKSSDGKEYAVYLTTKCPNGCENGVCKSIVTTPIPTLSPTPTTSPCLDSDGGQNIYKKGIAQSLTSGTSQEDCCAISDSNNPRPSCTKFINGKDEGNSVWEGICDSGGRTIGYLYVCPNGCLNGVCLQTSSTPVPTNTPVPTAVITAFNQNIPVRTLVLPDSSPTTAFPSDTPTSSLTPTEIPSLTNNQLTEQVVFLSPTPGLSSLSDTTERPTTTLDNIEFERETPTPIPRESLFNTFKSTFIFSLFQNFLSIFSGK